MIPSFVFLIVDFKESKLLLQSLRCELFLFKSSITSVNSLDDSIILVFITEVEFDIISAVVFISSEEFLILKILSIIVCSLSNNLDTHSLVLEIV